ncbi:ankyrin repeat domain-containing protein [Wolbachia endosymbiont of Pentalonia nigronervosa]|uniref:ankyrin repeat domain-containing protein n=1 Tax=Wolbachia endosymbiont of Pentalonia nigronervosa TaxID=1301914 RepID=UPI00165FC281|nr:ankyrin repeat domain-containing protein [Wolbachia endosymbiont of Pentalonia nigronervosa]MBD0392042.1 ankyrin repeat domain-containing protein [Wolbachia endosymbiont of Pentalonia nigronervosa]
MGVNKQQSTATESNVVHNEFEKRKQASTTKLPSEIKLRKRSIEDADADEDRLMQLYRSKKSSYIATDAYEILASLAGVVDLSKYALNIIPESLIKLSRDKTALSLEKIERYIMNNDLSKQLIENYWAIDRSHDLLLSNQGSALPLTNTGILMGITFMLMVVNGKAERNYEDILRVEARVSKNYGAIRRVESKADINLKAILSGFKILEYNPTSVIEKEFQAIIDFVKHTKIEEVSSGLITFIRHFIQEKDAIKNLTHDQYITKLEEINSTLHRLQNSRTTQPGSLHTFLYNIIDQKFAVPENSNDKVAFTALGLLYFGTEIYISVMSFLLEEYSYLANSHYQQNDLEKYNYYFSLISTTFYDFKSSLTDNSGLINKVISILSEVESYDFIQDEREDIVKFAAKRIDILNSIKSKIAAVNNLSQDKPTEKVKYNFSSSRINTPIGKWEDKRMVSYAVQFHSNGTYYQIGEWSIPYAIRGKANPSLDIGTDPQGRTRLIFRKFDNDIPELVGIVTNSNQREFRDINRDLYNAVLEPNEDVAIDGMRVFLTNGADINARYERGGQAIHAAAENGSSRIIHILKNTGADINAIDINGYAPIHIAAEMGYENFIQNLISNGANINAKTDLGDTALHIAAEKGHVNTVKNLMRIKGIDINAKNNRGFTPLHTAASFGKNNVIISLLQDNRTDINAQSEAGFTPLHLATIGEYSDAVKALLISGRVDINAKTKGGLTALHFASLTGDLAIIRSITRHSEVSINEKSADGWTPLHLAINAKQENTILELLSIDNIRPLSKPIYGKKFLGEVQASTAEYLGVFEEYSSASTTKLPSEIEFQKMSIEINAKGQDDLTPLHLAAASGQGNIVSKLLGSVDIQKERSYNNNF